MITTLPLAPTAGSECCSASSPSSGSLSESSSSELPSESLSGPDWAASVALEDDEPPADVDDVVDVEDVVVVVADEAVVVAAVPATGG